MGLNICANNPIYLFLYYVIYVLLNITKNSGVLYIYKSGYEVDYVLQVDFKTDSQCGTWFASRLRIISRLVSRFSILNLVCESTPKL